MAPKANPIPNGTNENDNVNNVSYQSVSTTETGSALRGHTLRPMGYITSQQRKHRILVVSLLCAFVAALGSLVVWRLRLEMVQPEESKCSTTLNDQVPDLFRDEQQEKAKAALDNLNHHLEDAIHDGCESTLLVMRHCDKIGPYVEDDVGEKHCSYLGFERAEFIATLFGNATTRSRWPTPSRLYALSSDRGNYREWETLLPLSKKTGVDIEFIEGDGSKFASDHYWKHLQSGELCGKVSVVCWRHGRIPSLVTALGCGPDNGCPLFYPEESFDQVWQLKFVFRPPAIQFESSNNGVSASKDQAARNETANRRLKYHQHLKHHHRRHQHDHHHHDDSSPGWVVYASVTNQNFDPLAFSRDAGDYPDDGTAVGGRWKDDL